MHKYLGNTGVQHVIGDRFGALVCGDNHNDGHIGARPILGEMQHHLQTVGIVHDHPGRMVARLNVVQIDDQFGQWCFAHWHHWRRDGLLEWRWLGRGSTHKQGAVVVVWRRRRGDDIVQW